MSNPTDLPPHNPDDQPESPAAPDADQPTEAYPPVDDQPTEAYPPSFEEPSTPVAPATDAAAQPVHAPTAPAYAAPVAPPAPAPATTDTRPKRLAWIALGLAAAGLVLVLIAFLPLLWVSFALAIVGGILLLAGLVVGIMVLVKKTQGGKGLGIGAIIVSVLGGGAWVGALAWSLLLIGLASAGGGSGMGAPTSTPPAVEESAAPAPSDEATAEATEAPDDSATGVYDEAAYLAEVRPTLTALFMEIDPTITEEVATMVFPDESLVQIGQAVISGDLNREALVASLVSEDAIFSQEQAERFYDTIEASAQRYLVE